MYSQFNALKTLPSAEIVQVIQKLLSKGRCADKTHRQMKTAQLPKLNVVRKPGPKQGDAAPV